MNRHPPTHIKFRRKVQINSLEAAICNVALFKTMKEKEFKDQIFISYCQQGVILQAIEEDVWKQANEYIQNFLKDKKIALLTYGYEKDIYQELIIKGLKQYTRRIKQKHQECPYINIIHYQKLRKSCQYMDKQKYVDPLKDWQKKYKANPNFAFLIVEPKDQFAEVKKNLLEFLLGRPVGLQQIMVSPIQFLYYFYNSQFKEQISEQYKKKFIQLNLCEKQANENGRIYQQPAIKILNYSQLDLTEYDFNIFKNHKMISKLGLEFISSKDVKQQICTIKNYLRDSGFNFFEKIHQSLLNDYSEDYAIIAFKKVDRQKYNQMLLKLTSAPLTRQQLFNGIKKYVVCQGKEIQFLNSDSLNDLDSTSNYVIKKGIINSCPYMIHQHHNIKEDDLQAFLIFLEQSFTYYNTYIVRFYGIAFHPTQKNTYYLIYDYHSRTLLKMLENSQILDNCQIGTMILQILYLIRFLHSHQQPRCLGKLTLSDVYWPMCMVLPYLSQSHENSIEEDIKLVGLAMKQLFGEDLQEAQDFKEILECMLRENKHERITLTKCISTFQELLSL